MYYYEISRSYIGQLITDRNITYQIVYFFFTAITCNRESLAKNDSFKVSGNRSIYGYHDEETITCNVGYNGLYVNRKCIGLNTWTNEDPLCRRKIINRSIVLEFYIV